MTTIVLFDIDGTLVLTGQAGARAMKRAFHDVFGHANGVDSIPMAGRTDAWIVAQVAALHGAVHDAVALTRFHDTYVDYLTHEIEKPGPRKGVLPGVRDVLEALAGRDDVFLGLLTGNYERGARIKLEYFDLWRYFRCGAFGDVTRERNALLGTALERVEACGVPRVAPSDIVIVGDTPLDVAVAHAGGVRSLAVATGSYDVAALEATGADTVLEDLSNLQLVVEALGLQEGRPGTAPGRMGRH